MEVNGIITIDETVPDTGTTADPPVVTTLVGCGFPKRQKVDVRIVNYESQIEVPPNHVGEIWISSPSKAAGYFGKEMDTYEEFNARILKQDELHNGKYLRTGDLGFIHNDELFICGRLKDLIIVGGRNYYPQDLEATAENVSEKCRPGCSAAFTVDVSKNGGEEVALIVELREASSDAAAIPALCEPLADQIKAAVNQEHSLGISYIAFLRTRTIPKTSSGKIARAWCRKGFLAGTLQEIYRKSYVTKSESITFEIDGSRGEGDDLKAVYKSATPLTEEKVEELRALEKNDIIDNLRQDVSKIGQIPPDSVDNDTALVTILDSLSLSQFKGRLESAYAVKISDEYLFGETITLNKLVEVVKLGYAPDDTTDGCERGQPIQPQGGTADGLAGALGCPPGVKVCCAIQ